MTPFLEQITSRKGSLGERYGEEFLRRFGYQLYRPGEADGAHAFDRMAVRRSDRTAFISDFKTKPARVHYPDTGIDVPHRDEYWALCRQQDIDCLLMFLDEDNGRVCGQFLRELERHRTIAHRGRKLDYPRSEWTTFATCVAEIRYYPLAAMRDIGVLTPQQCAELRKLSTRAPLYAQRAHEQQCQGSFADIWKVTR